MTGENTNLTEEFEGEGMVGDVESTQPLPGSNANIAKVVEYMMRTKLHKSGINPLEAVLFVTRVLEGHEWNLEQALKEAAEDMQLDDFSVNTFTYFADTHPHELWELLFSKKYGPLPKEYASRYTISSMD